MKQNNVKQKYRLRYGMPEQKGETGMETEQTMEQRLGRSWKRCGTASCSAT